MAAWINICVKIQADISIFWLSMSLQVAEFEPPHEKTNSLHMRNQRHRSASRLPQS